MYEDKSQKVTEKIGQDPLSKEEKSLAAILSLKTRKQVIEDELRKAQELLDQREAKVIRSLQKNRSRLL